MGRTYNKKRNTYFLYEASISSYVSGMSDGNVGVETEFVDIIKEFFSPDKILGNEKKLFDEILSLAEAEFTPDEQRFVLRECKSKWAALNKRDIFTEQSRLLEKMYSAFGKESVNNEIENYKLIANIKNYFDSDKIVESFGLEKDILAGVLEIKKNGEEKEAGDDEEAIETEGMLDEQKALVALYRSRNPGFGLFLNDQLKKIKPVLKEASICPKCTECDLEMRGKVVQILHMTEEFKNRAFESKDLDFMLDVQRLAYELSGDGE